MTLFAKFERPEPFSPEANALALVRAKFCGLIPDQVTAEECVELMTLFAKFESDRADAATALLSRPSVIIGRDGN